MNNIVTRKECNCGISRSDYQTDFIFTVRFRRIGIEHYRYCSGCKGKGTAVEQGKCRAGDFYHRSGACGT